MRLYIGNLPYNASQSDVENWFAEAGFPLDAMSIVLDRETGQSRGFGFAEVNDPEQADALLGQCNGKEMMGRKLVINEARPKAPGGGPRGGGGFGGPRDDFGPPPEQFYGDDFGGGGGGGGGRGGRGKSRRGSQGNRREPRW